MASFAQCPPDVQFTLTYCEMDLGQTERSMSPIAEVNG